MEEIWQVVQDVGLLEGWWKAPLHFLLSGSAGLWAYWWMSTTLSRYYFGGISYRKLRKDVYGIHRYSLCLALSFAVYAHVLQDYTLNWF